MALSIVLQLNEPLTGDDLAVMKRICAGNAAWAPRADPEPVALTPTALLDVIVPDDAVCPDCHGSGYVDYSHAEYGRCPRCRPSADGQLFEDFG